MIKTLVSIEVDLSSSLAIRFACRLGGSLEMEIYPLYVKDAPPYESAIGAGWARRTWEKEIIRTGEKEISELIRPEMDYCPVLKEARVICGDRESEVLKIVNEEKFDCLVEGVHFPWVPQTMLKQIHSKLRRQVSAPLILVRSLAKLDRVALLCLDVKGTQILTTLFQGLWRNCAVPLALNYPPANSPGDGNEKLVEAVRAGERLLNESGRNVRIEELPSPTPAGAADKALEDYGLVAVAAERDIHKDSQELQWLSLVKNAALLAFH